jgi:class 3 adenylate cyclase
VRQLPGGTITLLFTDIEGSTRLLQQLGSRYGEILRECRALLRVAFEQWHGYEVDTQGDAFFVVFVHAADAALAAVTAQRALATHRWSDGVTVRVRVGLHTGEPEATEEGYVGLDVHRASRIMNVGHGGQVVLSQCTRDLIMGDLPDDIQLRDLGEYSLKDIEGLSHIFQLVISGLPTDFPPLRTAEKRLLEEALTTYQEVGNERGVVRTRQDLAGIAILQCNYALARTFMEENLAQYRAWGEEYHAAYPLYFLARILFLSRGDIQQAQSLAEESLASFRQVRNGRIAAYTLCLLAQIHLAQDNTAMARTQIDEAKNIFKEVGDRFGTTQALMVAGQVAGAQGDLTAALVAYRECWELAQTIGALEISAACLEGVGAVLVAQGKARSAVALWGRAAMIRADLIAPMPPVERIRYEQAVVAAREQLGGEEFQDAWMEGGPQKSLAGF